MTDPLIAGALRSVLSCVDPEMVIVFGSRSRGAARPDSDLDLIVVADCDPRRRSLHRELRERLGTLAVPVDVVLVTPTELARAAPVSFLRSVANAGTLVYERTPQQKRKERRRF